MILKNSFTISIIILLAAIASVAAISSRGEPVVVATNLENLPMKIAGYTATEDFFSDAVYRELNADKHVYRHYRSANGDQIDLYIGFYGTAKGGRTGHNPYACLPGAGWSIVNTNKIQLSADYMPDGAYVNKILAQNNSLYESVIHWYQSAGTKVLASGIQQNVQRFTGRLFHNRNDGAFVRVSIVSSKNQVKNAQTLLKPFAQEVLNVLPEYWPLEK